MNKALLRRRWHVAWWAGNLIGGVVFLACAWPLPEWRAITAFGIAWLTGFWAAVLVEIATQ